jgi:hypothetical protein
MELILLLLLTSEYARLIKLFFDLPSKTESGPTVKLESFEHEIGFISIVTLS